MPKKSKQYDNINIKKIDASKLRLLNFCSILNISKDTLTGYLIRIGYKRNNFLDNNILSEELIKKSLSEFRGDMKRKESITKIQHEFDFSKCQQTNFEKKENEKEYNFINLTINQFEKIKQTIIFSNETLDSNFDNNEALKLCENMSEPYIREICKQFRIKRSKELEFQIHYFANKALKIYGGYLLTFICKLRQLKFKSRNSIVIDTKKYKEKIPDFPLISFTVNNQQFQFSFFAKKDRLINKIVKDIKVHYKSSKNDNHSKYLGYLNENGNIYSTLEHYATKFDIFLNHINNTNEYEITSGVETGNCEICKRELTQPESCRLGIGPVCFKNEGYDNRVYIFS